MTLFETPLPTINDLIQAALMPPWEPMESQLRHAYWFRSGSEALGAALRDCEIAWFPRLFCKEALRHVRAEVRFYDINEDFEGDWHLLNTYIAHDRVAPSLQAVVVVHFFGHIITLPTRDTLSGALIVEDCAHVMPGVISTPNPQVFSPRKFWPIPNGGVLFKRGEAAAPVTANGSIVPWWTKRLIQRLPLPFHWLKQYQLPEPSTEDGPHPGLYVRSLALLYEREAVNIARKRSKNYYTLLRYTLSLHRSVPYCPYAFPTRGSVQQVRRLRKRGIPATLWPDEQSNIMLLPVHQDLTENDMERIGKAL